MNVSFGHAEAKMRKVGFIISPGYQPMGFAVTTPFEITNRQAAEPAYDIRMLSKDGGLVRISLGFQVLTEPLAAERYDLIIVGASMEDASPEIIEFIRQRGLIAAGSLQPASGHSYSRQQGFSMDGAPRPIGFVPANFGRAIPMCGSKRTGSSSLMGRCGLQPAILPASILRLH
jgi:hypothetical protein